jgi:hypothetical protein
VKISLFYGKTGSGKTRAINNHYKEIIDITNNLYVEVEDFLEFPDAFLIRLDSVEKSKLENTIKLIKELKKEKIKSDLVIESSDRKIFYTLRKISDFKTIINPTESEIAELTTEEIAKVCNGDIRTAKFMFKYKSNSPYLDEKEDDILFTKKTILKLSKDQVKIASEISHFNDKYISAILKTLWRKNDEN